MRRNILYLFLFLQISNSVWSQEHKASVTLNDGSDGGSEESQDRNHPQSSSTGNLYYNQVAGGVNEMFNRPESPYAHSQERLHQSIGQIKQDSEERQKAIRQDIVALDLEVERTRDQVRSLLFKNRREKIDLKSIPDPNFVPFQSKVEKPALRNELNRTYTDLFKISPMHIKQQDAREMGLISVTESEKFYLSNQVFEGQFFKELSTQFLDIAVGLDPVSGVGRSAYELITGKNLVTQSSLDTFDRTLAFAGLLTLGGSKSIGKIGKLVVGFTAKLTNAEHLLPFVREAIKQSSQFFSTATGKLLLKTRRTGVAASFDGFKLFDRKSSLRNPFPSDGWYARVVKGGDVEKILDGKYDFSIIKLDLISGLEINETFFTAVKDIEKVKRDPLALAKKLSLFKDPTGRELRNLKEEKAVLLKINLSKEKISLLRSPVDFTGDRKYGWVSMGRTAGGAREWLVDADVIRKNTIDPKQIIVERLFNE